MTQSLWGLDFMKLSGPQADKHPKILLFQIGVQIFIQPVEMGEMEWGT